MDILCLCMYVLVRHSWDDLVMIVWLYGGCVCVCVCVGCGGGWVC